jgi:xanthine dehydrogenase YagT iron-sulfur-binding subunit
MNENKDKPLKVTRRTLLEVGTSVAAISLAGGPQLARSADMAEAERLSDVVTVELEINGRSRTLTLDPRTTLLDVLREQLGLTGTKKGCDQGQFGACTVIVNGQRINSCLTLAVMHSGDEVTTVEGLVGDSGLHPMQAAFVRRDALQCGYCTPSVRHGRRHDGARGTR